MNDKRANPGRDHRLLRTTPRVPKPVSEMCCTTYDYETSDVLSSRIASIDTVSTMEKPEQWVRMSRNHKPSQCTLFQKIRKSTFIRFYNANFNPMPTHTDRGYDWSDRRGFWSINCLYRSRMSQETEISLATSGNLAQLPHTCKSQRTKNKEPCGASTLDFVTSCHRKNGQKNSPIILESSASPAN